MKLPVASHTMLNDFDNCPHKGFRKHIAKDLEKTGPSSEQGYSGLDIHKSLAVRISRGRALPQGMEKYEPTVAPIANRGPSTFTELPVAVDRSGRACGFYDDRVFVRGYIDVACLSDVTAVLFDWKTGKKREDPTELKLHAMMLKARYQNIARCIGYYVWLKHVDMGCSPLGAMHDLSDTVATWASVEQQMDEIEHMLSSNNFPKQPNPLCNWCPVTDCEHNSVKT